jgi:hypothetical protein
MKLTVSFLKRKPKVINPSKLLCVSPAHSGKHPRERQNPRTNGQIYQQTAESRARRQKRTHKWQNQTNRYEKL